MKELFRDRDLAKIGRCRAVLEETGIETFLKNENVSNTEAWIIEFDPTLCVVNDEDYDRAAEFIRNHLAEGAEVSTEEEVVCKNCGEKNPGNFAACWKCEQPLGE